MSVKFTSENWSFKFKYRLGQSKYLRSEMGFWSGIFLANTFLNIQKWFYMSRMQVWNNLLQQAGKEIVIWNCPDLWTLWTDTGFHPRSLFVKSATLCTFHQNLEDIIISEFFFFLNKKSLNCIEENIFTFSFLDFLLWIFCRFESDWLWFIWCCCFSWSSASETLWFSSLLFELFVPVIAASNVSISSFFVTSFWSDLCSFILK